MFRVMSGLTTMLVPSRRLSLFPRLGGGDARSDALHKPSPGRSIGDVEEEVPRMRKAEPTVGPMNIALDIGEVETDHRAHSTSGARTSRGRLGRRCVARLHRGEECAEARVQLSVGQSLRLDGKAGEVLLQV